MNSEGFLFNLITGKCSCFVYACICTQMDDASHNLEEQELDTVCKMLLSPQVMGKMWLLQVRNGKC